MSGGVPDNEAEEAGLANLSPNYSFIIIYNIHLLFLALCHCIYYQKKPAGATFYACIINVCPWS